MSEQLLGRPAARLAEPLVSAAAGSDQEGARGFSIAQISTQIIDIPIIRKHVLSSLAVTKQSYVLVRMRLQNGVEGIGEAATLGGPRWSEESVESIKANIDAYLGPALIGARADQFEYLGMLLDRAAKRNTAAKSALETAALDAAGKTLNLPVHALLGGAIRDRIPVLWVLASSDVTAEIEEAEMKLAARLHNVFKVKIGATSHSEDLKRLRRLSAALNGRAQLIVDANQAWDETTAVRNLPAFEEMGIALVEQPLPDWNLGGMARLRSRSAVPLMADESLFSIHDALAIVAANAADVFSLKLVKHGGMFGLRKVAAIGEAAGVGLYGGCLLETSIGAAAHLHVFSTLRNLAWGCEHFGPQILCDDLVTEPLVFSDFNVQLPSGPGLGLTLNEKNVQRFSRS